VESKLGRIRKENVLVYFEMLFPMFPGKTAENVCEDYQFHR
jgi:hypothetical protein